MLSKKTIFVKIVKKNMILIFKNSKNLVLVNFFKKAKFL